MCGGGGGGGWATEQRDNEYYEEFKETRFNKQMVNSRLTNKQYNGQARQDILEKLLSLKLLGM